MRSSNLHRLHVSSSNSSARTTVKPPPSSSDQTSMPLLLAHCLALACCVFLLSWVLQFRGGLPFLAQNPLLADHNDLIFNVHPVLMLVGFIVPASEAILVFKSVSGTKRYKKAVHLTIQGMAFVMSVLGIWAALMFHNAKGIANFYSLHSWLGLGTTIMFAFQWILGYVIYWYPGAAAKIRTALLPWHVFLGLFIYCLALISAETGLLEKSTFLIGNKVVGRYSKEAMLVNCIGLLIVVYGAVVILAATLSKARKEDASRSLD